MSNTTISEDQNIITKDGKVYVFEEYNEIDLDCDICAFKCIGGPNYPCTNSSDIPRNDDKEGHFILISKS